jgi:putative transposase
MPNLLSRLSPFFARLISTLESTLEQAFLHFSRPARYSITLSTAADFPRSNTQLIAENALLRQQLIILHRQIKKPHFTRSDRLWLVLLASRVQYWKDTLLILKPDTLLRWHRQGFHLFWKFKSCNHGSRPRLSTNTIVLIQQMAKENMLWGAERIRGELLKLDIKVATATIQKYMRQTRPPRAPRQTWSVVLNNHAKDVWACDFLPVIDLFFRQTYLFFIVDRASRRVVHFNLTAHPTDAWVAQQLREATPFGETPRFLIRDRDSKYGQTFGRVAAGRQIQILNTPYRAPKANGICERFLGSVRRECLDHMLIFGERHLYRVIKEYVAFFNQARPHQGLEQRIPEGTTGEESKQRSGKIIAFPVLNGLHHYYQRAA